MNELISNEIVLDGCRYGEKKEVVMCPDDFGYGDQGGPMSFAIRPRSERKPAMERTLQAKRAASAKDLRREQVDLLGVQREVRGLKRGHVERGRWVDSSKQRADHLMSLLCLCICLNLEK